MFAINYTEWHICQLATFSKYVSIKVTNMQHFYLVTSVTLNIFRYSTARIYSKHTHTNKFVDGGGVFMLCSIQLDFIMTGIIQEIQLWLNSLFMLHRMPCFHSSQLSMLNCIENRIQPPTQPINAAFEVKYFIKYTHRDWKKFQAFYEQQ